MIRATKIRILQHNCGEMPCIFCRLSIHIRSRHAEPCKSSLYFGRHQAQTVGLRTHFEPLRQSVAVSRGKGRATVGHGQDIGANGTAVDGHFRNFRQTDAFHLGTNGFHLTADFASQRIESAIVGGFAFELRHALRLQGQLLLILPRKNLLRAGIVTRQEQTIGLCALNHIQFLVGQLIICQALTRRFDQIFRQRCTNRHHVEGFRFAVDLF